jgi:hypothetical protein
MSDRLAAIARARSVRMAPGKDVAAFTGWADDTDDLNFAHA